MIKKIEGPVEATEESTVLHSSFQLVSDYRTAWENVIRGDAPLSKLDRFFNVPCFMVSLEGEMSLYSSQKEVTAFNKTRLDAFRSGDVRNAIIRAVDVVSQGPHLSLAIVNWELTRSDDSLERAWRHYYTILDGDSGNEGSFAGECGILR